MAKVFPGIEQAPPKGESLELYCTCLEGLLAERTLQLTEATELLGREMDTRRRIESSMRDLREKLEQEERARIARDIHDSIGQSLQAMKLNLKMQREQCRQGGPCKSEALNGFIDEITRISGELRDIVLALRPAFLSSTPIDQALRWLCGRMSERTGLKVQVSTCGNCSNLGDDIKLALFRICQEALANAVKHSGGDNIRVSLSIRGNSAQLSISDNGMGGASNTNGSSGSGMAIMRERTELVGGSVSLSSPPGVGTTICVEVPLA